MRELLFLAHRLPYPPNKGDKIRSWHMLRYLSRHFRVHLGCFIDDDDDWRHTKTVAALCASTRFIDLPRGAARWRAMQALLSRQAMSVQYYRDARLLQWVDGLLSGGKVRHALAFSGPMAQYIDGSAGRTLHRVIDFVDVDSDKWRQYGDSKPWPMSLLYRREAHLLLQYERHIAQQFTAASFVSPAEAALFRQCAPMARRKTGHFNNGVDAVYFAPAAAPAPGPYAPGAQVLVFTGAMDYWPNIDAVQWFVRHVWPALRHQFPQLRFYIVGSAPVPAVT
ncbi:MAG: TIGR03087 family PEP-CTERM/XrtA system glycosyltransferase, partial [Janthinobacterium sp.]